MRLRFAVALAAVAVAWYVTRPEQASNAAPVDPPAWPGSVAEPGPRATARVRIAQVPAPAPALPPVEPEPEPAAPVEGDVEGDAVEGDAAVLVRDVHVPERRFADVLGPSQYDEVITLSSGVPVVNDDDVESPDAGAPTISFSCGGGGQNNVYYVEGIDVTGLTFD